jgi:hypothetical protein
MDGRDNRALTDRDLDRELDAALEIDPSPEFLARVRMRIESEPRRAPWPLGVPVGARRWAVVGLGALAVAALAVAVIRPGRSESPRPVNQVAGMVPPASAPSPPSAPVLSPAPVPPSAEVASPGSGIVGPAAARSRARRAAPAATVAAPPVLVAANEVAALERLFARAREGRVDMSALPDQPDPPVASAPLAPIDAIDVAPISVSPLSPIEAAGAL